MDLHENTTYRVRSREGLSDGWVQERGLREGCSTSPILFNVFHQAVMRQAEKERKRDDREVGVKWRCSGELVRGNRNVGKRVFGGERGQHFVGLVC